ncbi:MAG TPA: DUF3105 domain-containing protein [Solirubrobacterales bacterium]|nr:DUF3105 domain-containing protein [Solirubrobacterales bacterium]
MGTRKEDRERLRQLRIETEQRKRKAERKWLVLGYAVAGLVTVAVLGAAAVLVIGSSEGGASAGAHVNVESGSTNGVSPDGRSGTAPQPVKVADLKTAAKKAGCELRLNLKDEGHEHIPPDSKTPAYETKPPTSGPHVEPPYQQADGAYSEMPKEIDIVHSLEHGRLEIQYSPSLSEPDQLGLKGLYDSLYAATLLFPNEKMPYEVAATTWTNLIGCKTYKGAITEDAIRDFGKATWGRYGGEPPESFPFTGPTPANPSS